jgi:HEAT repeat protein
MRETLLGDREDARVRGFMALGYGLCGERALLEAVLLGDAKARGSNADLAEVRAAAAFALGRLGDAHALGPLTHAAGDADESRHVRGFAAAALGGLTVPLAAPDVLKFLRDADTADEVRYGAAIAVGGVIGPDDRGALDLLGRIAQRDKNGGVRALLFMSLGRVGGDHAAVPIVAEMTTTKEQTIRGFTYVALGMANPEDAGPRLLREFTRRKNSEERAACALGMGLCGFKEGADLVRAELERDNPAYVGHAMIALGMLDDRAALEFVRTRVAGETNPTLLREAATSLALLEGPAAVRPALDRYAAVKSIALKGALAHVLGEVGDARVLAPFLAVVRDSTLSEAERAGALAALVRIAEPDAVSRFALYAVDLNTYVSCAAVAAAAAIY